MKTIVFRSIVCLLVIVACSNKTYSQSVRKIAVKQKLSANNGLSSYNVNKILQDRYGYIWIATQDGLNRYDGKNFIVYSKSSDTTHRLLGNVINDMVEDTSRNLLWVTTSYGGLNSIDIVSGVVNRSVKTSGINSFKSEWLKCIALYGKDVWIGTLNGLHVYDITENKFVPVDLPTNFSLPGSSGVNANVNAIMPDVFGNIWISFPDRGLALYEGKSRRVKQSYSGSYLQLQEKMGFLQFASRMRIINDSTFLWATDNGFKLVRFNRDGILSVNKDLPVNKYFGDKSIFTCATDQSGKIWFSTFNRLYVSDLESGETFEIKDIAAIPDNDYLNTVMHIFFDRDGHLWIGTQYGAGLCDIRQPAIVPYYRDRQTDTRISHAYYIFPVNDSLVYTGAQDGLYAVDVANDRIEKISDKRRFNYIFPTIDGDLIASTDEGLSALTKAHQLVPVQARYPELERIRNDMINSSVVIGDSVMILSSEKNNGLFKWEPKKKKLSPHSLGSGVDLNGVVNKLYRDSENRMWVLFDNAIGLGDGLSTSSRVIRLIDPQLGIPLNIYMDVCEAAGDYWLAVYGKGVVRLDKNMNIKKVYGLEEGLSNTGVYKVIPMEDSIIYVTTNYGLFFLDVRSQHIRQLLTSDGLNTNSFEENCGMLQNSALYVGGEQGISRIQPELFQYNKKPPDVFVNYIACETPGGTADTFDLNLSEFNIPATARQTFIQFSALNFSAPHGVNYEYKIAELKTGWIKLGTINSLNLIGLSPGTYTLSIRAANENGIWSGERSLRLRVMPKWYQTLWFKLFIIAVCVGAFYAFYQYRIHQLKMQNKIRRDISADLHDDIGSTLNSAKIFTHLAKKDSQQQHFLELVEQSIGEAMTSIRDIIWVLDDSQDTLGDLAERLKRFIHPLAEAKGIEVILEVGADHRSMKVPKKEKKTFFLIAKEAVNNSVKHSDCSRIHILLAPGERGFTLRIRDNGKGIVAGTGSGGHGLANMRNRAKQIGYKVSIVNGIENGVEVHVSRELKADQRVGSIA